MGFNKPFDKSKRPKRHFKPNFYSNNQKKEFKYLEITVRYTSDDPQQRDKDLEKALGQFKKLLIKEGLFQELKDRKYFKSKSRKRYEARQQMVYKRGVKKPKYKFYKRQTNG